MGKLKRNMGYEDVTAVLKRNGFGLEHRATHGDVWVHAQDPTRRAHVPRKPRVVIGALAAIVRDSGKDRSEFT